MKIRILFFTVAGSFFIAKINAQQIVRKTSAYEVYNDQVKQGKYTAKALSDTEMTSDYQSPVNESVSSEIVFKFSINGKDNEMKPNVNHVFNLNPGQAQTQLIKFGTPLKPEGKKTDLKPDTPLTIRLDMRDVLAQIKSKGFYTTFNGDKIYAADFKKVYVAGATAPLSWDFDNLHQRSELEMKDTDGDGIYETTLVFNSQKDKKHTDGNWKLNKNISAFPQIKSAYPLSDAIYNMSLEEMQKAIEPDSTFRTGKEWAGVWTRDISYSIVLSMAYMQPKVAMNSLMRKVNSAKRIIQDTGTGGAYPASTDRMIWSVAAFEVYKATGDKTWLANAYEIVNNSLEDDYTNAYDPITGMMHGESSFLDWREQTYPKWMQPADIYNSENLGTNAVHYQANKIAGEMAYILGKNEEAKKHKMLADLIKNGINKFLWMPDKGYYGQYLYGRTYKILSPRSEALGEALCVLFGIADVEKSKLIIAKVPVTDFGISCIYPQIPGIPPYHNDAVWPFVQSYWALASAKTGNETSLMESMAAIMRPAALFLTNKENFVAGTGDFAGTQINSSNMLWSLSGNIAMVHQVLFGIHFEADKLTFSPYVPYGLSGKRTLSNFKYRNAVLNISVEGFGNTIKAFLLDGKKSEPEVSANLKGNHMIKIVLDDLPNLDPIDKVPDIFSPETPLVILKENQISWQPVENAVGYKILRNGEMFDKTMKTSYDLGNDDFAEYQITAIDSHFTESFASEPIRIAKTTQIVEVESAFAKAEFPYKGFSGTGFTETSKTINPAMDFTVDVAENGWYAIDFRYSNGNGPTNTENKCAIRSLKRNGTFAGTFVFPQRGVQEWSNWGFSNSVIIPLTKGKNLLTLTLDNANENMNGAVNQAMLDYLRLTKIEEKK